MEPQALRNRDGVAVKKQKFAGVLLVLCLLLVFLALPVQVMAEDGVPAPVLEAKPGVLRIITVSFEGVYTGTGFAVGTDSRIFVVTNHHVVENAEAIYIFYDTGKYVTASIYHDDASRDICVLKPDSTMPRVQVLALEGEDFESGIAVYALGFPAAADYFTQDMEEEFDDAKALLASITADKQSMTITNGIVSAVHNSTLIGDGSRAVETLQTNTALNGGNSGGPLLNNAGHVVGVNTMGLSMADSINGAVHIHELTRVLREANVRYDAPSQASSTAAEVKGKGLSPLVVIVTLMSLCVVGGVAAAIVVVRRQKKMPVKGGMTLEDFEKSYRKIEEMATLEMTLRFVNDLLPLARYDLNPLFTPTNVIVGDNAIALREKSAQRQVGTQPVYPGFSAPEVLSNRAVQATTVYFVGAMMYTLLTGHRPPDARQRLAENTPVFQNAADIKALVNWAMEPYEQNRIQDLYQLAGALQQLADGLRRY